MNKTTAYDPMDATCKAEPPQSGRGRMQSALSENQRLAESVRQIAENIYGILFGGERCVPATDTPIANRIGLLGDIISASVGIAQDLSSVENMLEEIARELSE